MRFRAGLNEREKLATPCMDLAELHLEGCIAAGAYLLAASLDLGGDAHEVDAEFCDVISVLSEPMEPARDDLALDGRSLLLNHPIVAARRRDLVVQDAASWRSESSTECGAHQIRTDRLTARCQRVITRDQNGRLGYPETARLYQRAYVRTGKC